jgi:hypothetical protein
LGQRCKLGRSKAATAEEVLVLHESGWSIRAIAKQLGLSRMATLRLLVAARPAVLAEPGETSATVLGCAAWWTGWSAHHAVYG